MQSKKGSPVSQSRIARVKDCNQLTDACNRHGWDGGVPVDIFVGYYKVAEGSCKKGCNIACVKLAGSFV